jgi:hypothetical protein
LMALRVDCRIVTEFTLTSVNQFENVCRLWTIKHSFARPDDSCSLIHGALPAAASITLKTRRALNGILALNRAIDDSRGEVSEREKKTRSTSFIVQESVYDVDVH